MKGPLLRLIDLLAAEGLVEGREDPSGGNDQTLHLTERGDEKVEETNGVLRRVRPMLLKNIGAEELAATFKTLHCKNCGRSPGGRNRCRGEVHACG